MRHVTSGSIHPRQRGTVSLMAALLIAAIGVAALVSLDVGFVFYTQRQLQKLVDVAALSGAQQLKSADDQATTNANVLSSVTSAAAQNGYTKAVANDCTTAVAGAADGVRTCLGLWDPANPANGDSTRHFDPGYPATTVSANAVRVQATLTVPLLFMFQGASRGSYTPRRLPPRVRPPRRSRSAAACSGSRRVTACWGCCWATRSICPWRTGADW